MNKFKINALAIVLFEVLLLGLIIPIFFGHDWPKNLGLVLTILGIVIYLITTIGSFKSLAFMNQNNLKEKHKYTKNLLSIVLITNLVLAFVFILMFIFGAMSGEDGQVGV